MGTPGRRSLVEETLAVAPSAAGPGKQTRSEPRGLAMRTMTELSEASSVKPAHAVTAHGDPATLRKRVEDAIAARSPAGVLAAARDMDTASRTALASQLLALDFMAARDLLVIAGWVDAEPAQAVIAALQATPPLTRAQARAYLSSLTACRVREAFDDDALVAALRTTLGGSPIDLLPQVADDVALFGRGLLAWLIETSPPKLVARVLLGLAPSAVEMQCDVLDALGERGWAWLAAVDATIAAASAPGTLAAYRARAHQDASKASAATEHEHPRARAQSARRSQ